jgi:hypothetical protein
MEKIDWKTKIEDFVPVELNEVFDLRREQR